FDPPSEPLGSPWPVGRLGRLDSFMKVSGRPLYSTGCHEEPLSNSSIWQALSCFFAMLLKVARRASLSGKQNSHTFSAILSAPAGSLTCPASRTKKVYGVCGFARSGWIARKSKQRIFLSCRLNGRRNNPVRSRRLGPGQANPINVRSQDV